LPCGGQPVLRGGKLKIAEFLKTPRLNFEDFGFDESIGSVDRGRFVAAAE
jgi:hypothetical protein